MSLEGLLHSHSVSSLAAWRPAGQPSCWHSTRLDSPAVARLDQQLQWLRARVRELELWADRAVLDLTDWRFEGRPIALGASWPHRDGVLRFEHPAVRVPEDWPLEEVRLKLSPGGESLLRIDYGGETESFGVDPNHRRFPLRARQLRLTEQSLRYRLRKYRLASMRRNQRAR